MKSQIITLLLIFVLSGCFLQKEENTKETKIKTDSYTVSFASNGGSTVSPQKADYDTPISEPASPTKTGYTFAGWYKDSSLNTVWKFETDKVAEDTTLYAKWIKLINLNSLTVDNITYDIHPVGEVYRYTIDITVSEVVKKLKIDMGDTITFFANQYDTKTNKNIVLEMDIPIQSVNSGYINSIIAQVLDGNNEILHIETFGLPEVLVD